MNYTEKKELFEKLVADTQTTITERHDSAAWKTWGWVRNKWGRMTGSAGTAQAAKVAVKLALIPLQGVPFVGAMISAAGNAAIDLARRKWLERCFSSSQGEERFQAMGELLPAKWADGYIDAVRKLDTAGRALNNYPVQSCATMLEYLNRFYYWKYRLDRLWFYHMLMVEYLGQVDQKFQDAERTWKEMERDLKLNGPKLFDDWQWHRAHCNDECCTYPWDNLQISGPTLTGTTADLASMNLKPIKKQPPPLPPRPPKPR